MKKEKKEKQEFWEWTKALLIAFGVAFVIRYFLFTPIVVDGDSMMPTLADGDRMVVNKINYKINKPERFDIVVFHAPENKNYIKRVIGLPGEHISYENDQLYVNGKQISEPYLKVFKNELLIGTGTLTEDFSLEDIIQLKKIPEGHVFVLGDNRRYSKDSRIIGVVPIEEIIGDTSMVFWPLDESGIVE